MRGRSRFEGLEAWRSTESKPRRFERTIFELEGPGGATREASTNVGMLVPTTQFFIGPFERTDDSFVLRHDFTVALWWMLDSSEPAHGGRR